MLTKRQLQRHNATQSDTIVRLRGERDTARKETERMQDRINELALAHTPKFYLLYGAESLPVVRDNKATHIGSVFDKSALEMKCSAKNCPYMWPCPTYLWATESEPFTLAVIPKSDPT